MAYKTEDLFNQGMEAIKKNRLIFIEDIIAYLPCSKPTFYEHFPNESDLYNKMNEELTKNKVELKVSMRSKWYKSNAPVLQLSLYKLLSSDEERKLLSTTYSEIDHTTQGEKIESVTVYQLPDNGRNKGIEEDEN